MSKILFISDCHLRKPEDNAFRALLKSIEAVVDMEEVEALLLGGDIADFANGFQRVLGDLSVGLFSGIPILVVSGNHDVWEQYWKHNYKDTSYIFFNEMPAICDAIPNVHWMEGKTMQFDNWLIAGTMAWYDYSSKIHAPDGIRTMDDDFFHYNKGGHSADARYAHFSMRDKELSNELRRRLLSAINLKIDQAGVDNLAVFTHVPMFKEDITWKPTDYHWNLGCQYFYNLTLGDELMLLDKLKLTVSGHTHFGRTEVLPRYPLLGHFQHLVSYADYGYPEAFEIDLFYDGNVNFRRIGMNSRFDIKN